MMSESSTVDQTCSLFRLTKIVVELHVLRTMPRRRRAGSRHPRLGADYFDGGFPGGRRARRTATTTTATIAITIAVLTKIAVVVADRATPLACDAAVHSISIELPDPFTARTPADLEAAKPPISPTLQSYVPFSSEKFAHGEEVASQLEPSVTFQSVATGRPVS